MNHSHSEEKPAIISWTAAKAAGLKQYFTGHPCKHGHVDVRDVSDRSCYTCKLIKAAKWKHLNPEKHAEASGKWQKKNPESLKNTRLRRKSKNPRTYWARACVNSARSRAKEKGFPFNITVEYILSITPDVCPVFGVDFDFAGTGRIRPESPSIDKIIPEKGYVMGNIAVISMKANSIKRDATLHDIKKVVAWLETVVS